MKSTEHFKAVIKDYLDKRAASDELFAVSYAKPNKNLDDCVTYIINWVKKSNCNGFADDEIFGQAVHYYDEDKIDIGKPIDCKIVTNHRVELTEFDKEQAKEQAMRELIDEKKKSLKTQITRPKEEPQKVVLKQASLFD